MFTGLVEVQGTVQEAAGGRFVLSSPWSAEEIKLGASIACDGCCLTVVSREKAGHGAVFAVDVSEETLSTTTLSEWHKGRHVNLERSLKAGDELGGHLVSGHVDGVAMIETITEVGFSKVFAVRPPASMMKYVATKGSVALDGISLTVNAVEDEVFFLNLIPTTLNVTTWGQRNAGDQVNMEVDLIARYVARLLGR